MTISLEALVESIVREVVAELKKRGVEISARAQPGRNAPGGAVQGGASLEVDMTGFRSPVLTESRVQQIGAGISTLVVPCRTVVTPGAWDVIKAKKLTIVRKA